MENQQALHQKASAELVDLVALAYKHYEALPAYRSLRRIGPFNVAVLANDSVLGERLTHCMIEGGQGEAGAADMDILILSGAATPNLDPPSWNFPHSDPRHLERLHLSADGDISAFYDHDRKFWMIQHRAARRALFWVAQDGEVPFWEDAAPFKTLLHWSLAGSELAIVHGGVVVGDCGGALLVGPGGSGKSTTVAACFAAGMAVSGDDLVLIDKSTGIWHGHAIYDALKLSPDSVIPMPGVLTAAPSRPCGEKVLVRYSDARSDGLASSVPLVAIIQCVIDGGSKSVIEPLPPGALLKALAPPTVFLLRGHESHSLRLIGALVRGLKCYRLRLSRDPEEVASCLAQFLETAD